MEKRASSIELRTEEREYLELQTRARTIQAQTVAFVCINIRTRGFVFYPLIFKSAIRLSLLHQFAQTL